MAARRIGTVLGVRLISGGCPRYRAFEAFFAYAESVKTGGITVIYRPEADFQLRDVFIFHGKKIKR